MEISKDKELIQQILSNNPQDEKILKDMGIIAEHQEVFEEDLEGNEVLAEDAEYLESLSDEELMELASSYDEIFASLDSEGCGDIAELLYEVLFHSEG